MNDKYQYGKHLIIQQILEMYQILEGGFDEEIKEIEYKKLYDMTDRELIIELGFVDELIHDK